MLPSVLPSTAMKDVAGAVGLVVVLAQSFSLVLILFYCKGEREYHSSIIVSSAESVMTGSAFSSIQ